MKRWILFVILLTAFVLSACAQQPQTADTPEVSAQAAATATVSQVNPSTEPVQQKEASCTVRTAKPTPGPTEQALLPPPNEDDWQTGPDNAYITLIEYGDYQ